jgi:hypothetical protein
MVGERRFELPASWSRTKRATKLRYSPTELYKYTICGEMSRGEAKHLWKEDEKNKSTADVSRPLRSSPQRTQRGFIFCSGRESGQSKNILLRKARQMVLAGRALSREVLRRSPNLPIPKG